jgi:hypothetical protein
MSQCRQSAFHAKCRRLGAPAKDYKKSGYGREKGLERLKDDSQVRTVIARIG